MTKPDLATVAPGGELKSRECIDRHRVGLDSRYVAESDVGAAPVQQPADSLAKPGQVGGGDGASDGESDRLRRRGGHLETDRREGENSSPRKRRIRACAA